MKKLLLGLTLLLSFTPRAQAALSQADLSINPTPLQLLLNPGFENGVVKWTNGSGTLITETTTVLSGTASASWSTAATPAKIFQDVTPPSSYQNVVLEASCWVNTTVANIQVCARSGGTAGNCIAATATGVWQYLPVNFLGPASGTVGVQVSTTTATSFVAFIDQCYVGKATNPTATKTQEVPTGSVNSSNTSFVLVNTPANSFSVSFFIDGILQTQGVGKDYTISGATITTAVAPSTGQTVWATYSRY